MKRISILFTGIFIFFALANCSLNPADQGSDQESKKEIKVEDSKIFAKQGDYLVAGGDMLFDPNDESHKAIIDACLNEESGIKASNKSRSAFKNIHLQWKDGKVPFYFDPKANFSDSEKIAIRRAMDVIESHCGVKFTQWPFFDHGWLSSYQLKMLGIVRLSDPNAGGAATVGQIDRPRFYFGQSIQYIIVHELMHVLGYGHEQGRRDRDDYVNIIWANIMPDYHHNFEKFPVSFFEVPIPLTQYDYNSIMHYDSYSFNIFSTIPTITKKDGSTIGDNKYLSENDIKGLQYIYGY